MYDFEKFKNGEGYIKINSTWQFHEVMLACEQAGLVWHHGRRRPTQFTPTCLTEGLGKVIHLIVVDEKCLLWSFEKPTGRVELLPIVSEVEKFDEVLVYLDKELGWRTQSVKYLPIESKDKMIRDVKFLEQLIVSRVSELIRGGK